MLVLSRKPDEAIILGDGEIVIRVVAVHRGNNVRISIDAPDSLRINREEIYLRMKREGKDVLERKPK